MDKRIDITDIRTLCNLHRENPVFAFKRILAHSRFLLQAGYSRTPFYESLPSAYFKFPQRTYLETMKATHTELWFLANIPLCLLLK